MSIRISRDTLLKVVGGTALPSEDLYTAIGVEQDSRLISGGELFIALKGENIHGHEFVPSALERGAALCLVESADLDVTEKDRLVVVPDTLKAYWTLAEWWRKELALPLIAITGSVGKTTVKEMTARVLLETGAGVYSQKSYNNHVGVPYTICQSNAGHGWIVLEMGMNHAGEISDLTRIAAPDCAAICKIAPAHIEHLGSIENIARAKLEVTEGIKQNGALILNADDPMLLAEYKKIARSDLTVTNFGLDDDATMEVTDVKSLLLDGIFFKLKYNEVEYPVSMKILGTHNAMNAACAALCALTLLPDMSMETIVQGLEKFYPPLMRLQVKEMKSGMKIVDDTYNANPESMSALLTIAQELKTAGATVGIVLGDMLELGHHSAAAHEELGRKVADLSPAFFIGVGPHSELAVKAAEESNPGLDTFHVSTAAEAAKLLAEGPQLDIVLLKASRGIGLDKTVELLVSGVQFVPPAA